MQELISKYGINDGFYNRYFRQNAQFRYGVEMLQFLYFKKGKFLNPQKKDFYFDGYTKEEIVNFFEKQELNIPQLTFCITSKCSLNCKDCGSLIPPFNDKAHIDMSCEEFRESLDKICNCVTKIRRFVILGGEPLLHSDLSEMINLACEKENIDVVEVITNGTIIPSKEILQTMKKYNKKTYLYISNYSSNPEIEKRLKHDEIKKVLEEYNIKLQMVEVMGWLREFGFKKTADDFDETVKRYKKCHCSHCTQVFNSKIYLCSKASSAIELGLVNVDDYIDLRTTTDLKKDFIEFYNKDYLKACEYCILSDVKVKPALQMHKVGVTNEA